MTSRRDHVLASSPPRPPLDIVIDRAQFADNPQALRALPEAPGVFVLCDDAGHTLALGTTANLRRLVRSRVFPDDDAPARRSSSIDSKHIAEIRAGRVGSPFEAEWAYMQWAQELIPHAVAALTDRWSAWFVQVDSSADHPRFTKTRSPVHSDDEGNTRAYLGPFPDKHAAGRYIELLEATFDLCRYHQILVQSPNASACAYKEMSRCPAPCDGTVSLDAYRGQIRDAIAFACSPFDHWLAQMNRQMTAASERLDFELAGRLKRIVEDAADAGKPAFAHVDAIDSFSFLSVQPIRSARIEAVRLFVIRGGWIAPLVDIPVESDADELIAICQRAIALIATLPTTLDEQHRHNMGLVCAHLFDRSSGAGNPGGGSFVRCTNQSEATRLAAAIGKMMSRRVAARKRTETAGVDEADEWLERETQRL